MKADVLAEGVHRVHQSGVQRGRQDVVAHQINIVVAALPILWWQGVGGEQGALYPHPEPFTEPGCGFQHTQLGVWFQAIAGFDFYRGGTVVEQRLKTRYGRFDQLFGRGFPGCPDCGHDAATCPGNVRVADALKALFELFGAIARVDQMRVAVDKARS